VFNADGSIICFTCTDGKPRLYDVPRPVPDELKTIRCWAKANSGYLADEEGILHQLSQAEWLESQVEVNKLLNGR
jgi:hypothetical protein